ncbi:MAG TPA: HlyD family secretion protein [Stellaceae bacterium]|nr:HlyD family secretion protein [Stellaceae bacterium]
MAADGGAAVALRDAERDRSQTKAARRSRRRLLRWALFALLPLVLLALAYFYVTGGAVMSTDDAYIEADKLAVTTDVSGIVQAVDVSENEKVAAGQVLFRLDDAPFRFALQRAEAQLGTVRDDLAALKASYREKQQEMTQAKNDVAFYEREFQRQQELLSRHVASQAAFDQARHNLETAQQKLAALAQQGQQIIANLDGNPELPVEQHPRYRDALAQRDEAARELAHTVVKAPMAGVVTKVSTLQPGQYLPAGTAAFSLVATDHVWVEADPKETQLTYVRPGQTATVRVDAYPDEEWHGTVASLSPASAAEFSLLPAQNTSGNWVKVVQRIPIRIRIDTSDPAKPPLRAGMSVELDVDTGHARGLPRFLAALFGGSVRSS